MPTRKDEDDDITHVRSNCPKDAWKPRPKGMYNLNANSDKPDPKKNQIFYVLQEEDGVVIVDADKLDAEFNKWNGRVTMHQLAWEHKNSGKPYPEGPNRPVLGGACRDGQLIFNSGTYNTLSPNLDGRSRSDVPEKLVEFMNSLYFPDGK